MLIETTACFLRTAHRLILVGTERRHDLFGLTCTRLGFTHALSQLDDLRLERAIRCLTRTLRPHRLLGNLPRDLHRAGARLLRAGWLLRRRLGWHRLRRRRRLAK